MSSRGMCAGNAVFYHTEVVSESKIVREMLCFTIETSVGGREGRRCETAVAAMIAYARLWSPRVGSVLHWEVKSQVLKVANNSNKPQDPTNPQVQKTWCAEAKFKKSACGSFAEALFKKKCLRGRDPTRSRSFCARFCVKLAIRQ